MFLKSPQSVCFRFHWITFLIIFLLKENPGLDPDRNDFTSEQMITKNWMSLLLPVSPIQGHDYEPDFSEPRQNCLNIRQVTLSQSY